MLAQEPPPSARTPNSGKRFRPPTLDISGALERRPSIQVETDPTPVKEHADSSDDDSDNDVFEDTLQLSSPESIDGFKGVTGPGADEIEKELADLDELRRSVKQNLKVRPIRSRTDLKIQPNLDGDVPLPPFPTTRSSTLPNPPDSAASSNPPESALSSYFTPLSEIIPHQSIFAASSSTTTPCFTAEPTSSSLSGPSPSKSGTTTPRPQAVPISAKSLYDRLRSSRRPLLIDARSLAAHEAFHIRSSINIAIPSLILKRCKKPGGGFQSLETLQQYITTEYGKATWEDLIAKPGGGAWDGDVVIYDDDMNPNDKNNVGSTAWAIIPVISPLLSYGTVHYLEGGISSAGHDPDLQTLILSGEEASSRGVQATADAAASRDPTPQQKTLRKPSVGLFQLDTQTTYRSRQLPELEPSSTVSTNPPSPIPPPAPSPLPVMPASSSSSSLRASPNLNGGHAGIEDPSPSPPPSSLAGFRRPPPPRRPSVPNLRKIDTRSMEKINTNLPKLSLRTKPMRSATLAAPPTLSLQVPTSPSHLKLAHSTHSPISPSRHGPMSAYPAEPGRVTGFFTPPHSPGTPKAASSFSFNLDAAPPPSPNPMGSGSFSLHPPSNNHSLAPNHLPDPPPTARPDAGFDLEFDNPPSTSEEEEAFPTFAVSTILPNFLYLGPELTSQEHVDELKSLGVKRILNIAAECDDDQGLGLREVFEKYLRIPMRDTVEEDNITKDDARLHSAPTYVHCKAGKSRSVTAVMAYLIHANRWTLSRAYAFVLERRKGISPNIGFVSELMNFEEQELGNKSVGVQPSAPVVSGTAVDMQEGFAAAVSSGNAASSSGMGVNGSAGVRSAHGHLVRSRTHVRDSLPPAIGMDSGREPMSAGGVMDRVNIGGDSAQEVEVKDAHGRYRHARRAPVNESTLQPMRRVSKAGLESFVVNS
ncbi:MAP kinase phosphatase [Coprinopsis cinerea okayama7|uniref:protein-tyrosine-phosphatase n=1 Tax=Coprinopsis cinerea (strain Okayama-7 / 130 / ATCC MYA-4618 / FGSC 9003) TaxID=240176 RepID=A8NJE2_COPC7|nr:MAP kinase phosphatase [Coprinopsis cinerea okayama7\|eukprot:XP_001834205.2 MAP kinase phosphatase [Coprinopsis cinerea okayama7\